jgi:hypothetical protein
MNTGITDIKEDTEKAERRKKRIWDEIFGVACLKTYNSSETGKNIQTP